MNQAATAAAFETVSADRVRVTGMLDFETVSKLLATGTAAIEAGTAAVIDLSGITGSDSSGLALVIEWLSVAQAAHRTLRYENVPAQLLQLARLSEVDDLLEAAGSTAPPATAAPAVAGAI